MMHDPEPEPPMAEIRQQNDASIIFHLPVETLYDIFLLTNEASQSPKVPKANRWNCFQIGHVCHRWRTITIDLPLLWVIIDFQLGNDAVSELLTRSNAAPISQRAHIYPGSLSADMSMEIIPSELHRVRALQCSGRHLAVDELFESLSHTPAPTLEYLEAGPSYGLPLTLFDEYSPALRTLVITACEEIDCHSHLFHHLVNLRITHSALVTDVRASDIADMLIAMASTIEDIDINELKLLFSDTHTPNPTRTVALPKLLKLSLMGDIDEISSFTSLIDIDHPISLTLHLNIDSMLHNIQQQLPTILEWVSTNMRFQLGGDMDIETSYVGYRCNMQFKVKSSGPPVVLNICFFIDDPGMLNHNIQAVVCNPLPLTHVKSLSINEAPSASFWLQAHSNMCGVEKISLPECQAMDGFFHALVSNISFTVTGDAFMPKLRVIEICGMDFNRIMSDNRTVIELVLEGMVFRKSIGSPIGRLEIKKCKHVKDEVLELLGEQVEAVVWDKVEVANLASSEDVVKCYEVRTTIPYVS